MADTKRTLAALQTLLADNSSAAISEQDVRDAIISCYPDGIAGAVQFAPTGVAGTGSAATKFFWDQVNDRLGINTAAPTVDLDVTGDALISGVMTYGSRLENIELVTSTNVLTSAESGKVLVLNSATAFVTTLPAKEAGVSFKFICGANEVTGGNHTIIVNAADDDTLFGQVQLAGAVLACDTKATITLVADKFVAGDWIEVINDGVNWYVKGQVVTAAGVTFDT